MDPSTDLRWDAFVRRHSLASGPYHLGAWAEILKRSYGFKPHYLALERDGELRGVLPLVGSRGILSGRRLRSLPIVPSGGPVAESDGEISTLMHAACQLAAAKRSKVLAVQSLRSDLDQLISGLRPVPIPPKWVVEFTNVPPLEIGAWKKKAHRLYRSVRRAEQSGVTFRESHAEADLRGFYGLYLAVMRRRRAWPKPYRQLTLTRQLLGDEVFKLFVVERNGKLVAATVSHAFGDTVEILYSASDPRELDARPNHALWWGVIRWAAENGFARTDLGEARWRSQLEDFKRQFLAEEHKHYRYEHVIDQSASRADAARDATILLGRSGESLSRRQALLSKAWSKAPLTLTRIAGMLTLRYA